jgi:glycosyltransferase involved in cell wall biosynthesis
MLVRAWGRVRPEGWDLVIAGPDENGHRREVEAEVERQGLGDMVSFPGPVRGEEKWTLYRESDLFVLPTHSENFGIVVAEALASGVPALTTTGAPWSVLEDESCGWWVDPNVGALTDALSKAVGCTDDERLAMGQRGRALVEEQYSWAEVVSSIREMYRWTERNEEFPTPDCIKL